MPSKNVLVVGASSGIGKELVIQLIDLGHTVYCGARRLEKMVDLEAIGAKIIKVDIRNETDVDAMVATMIEEVGHIDIVYANAGYAIAGPVEETPISKVQQQFDTNVYGAARLARAVLPHMRERNSGRIIFTSSIAGRVSTSMNAWYSSTKHALNGMVKGLAQEVAAFNISVSTIEPGAVQTEFDAIQLSDMKATSSKPEYQEVVAKSHNFLNNAYRSGSSPQSTVRHMIKAGFDRKPRLCYQATHDAKLMYWLQKIFGEQAMGSLFTRLIQRTSL